MRAYEMRSVAALAKSRFPSPPGGAFLYLPLVGREGRSEAKARVGVSKTTFTALRFSRKRTPPPDRCFAHSRCEASAFLLLTTATEGRLCTLPTLAPLAGEG